VISISPSQIGILFTMLTLGHWGAAVPKLPVSGTSIARLLKVSAIKTCQLHPLPHQGFKQSAAHRGLGTVGRNPSARDYGRYPR
jgi:hypothetical protein